MPKHIVTVRVDVPIDYPSDTAERAARIGLNAIEAWWRNTDGSRDTVFARFKPEVQVTRNGRGDTLTLFDLAELQPL